MPITPKELIRNLGELPPLPKVATRVIHISADADSSMEELKELVRTDQALSAQLLKVANSAMFSMIRGVTTLSQALITLGFSTARSVVLASSVKNLFTRGPVSPQERILWKHALASALTAGAFSRALRLHDTEEVFLAGLLHDLGKGVMILKFPEGYGALLRKLHEQGGDALSYELDTFGFDHTMVGEALLDSWNFSTGSVATVRWHHEPTQAPLEHQRLVALVALGNQMAMDLQIGLGSPDALAGATWEAMDILGLSEARYQDVRTTVLEALEHDQQLLVEF